MFLTRFSCSISVSRSISGCFSTAFRDLGEPVLRRPRGRSTRVRSGCGALEWTVAVQRPTVQNLWLYRSRRQPTRCVALFGRGPGRRQARRCHRLSLKAGKHQYTGDRKTCKAERGRGSIFYAQFRVDVVQMATHRCPSGGSLSRGKKRRIRA